MTKLLDPSHLSARLRQQAEQQLSNGSVQLNNSFVASPEALGVLYRLSGDANTASDGLKLLHELQVHQVELDMQLEQLQNNEHESNHDFACYQQFFTMNPVSCLILNTDGIITSGNAAASRMFSPLTNLEKEQTELMSLNLAQPVAPPLCGRSLLSLLSSASQPLFSAALARVLRSKQRATLLVRTAHGTAGQWRAAENTHFRMTISMSPDQQAILIMLT